MRKYKNKSMAELASELRSGLRRLQIGYLEAAEKLLRIIDPSQVYPYPFVVFRLTGYRPDETKKPVLLDGNTLQGDLLSLLLDVSESFELHTSDLRDLVYDMPSLARRFDVSTKTVQRWRKRGLPAVRLIFPDGRRRLGVLERSVDWFLHQHQREVQRSSHFSHLTDDERDDILRRARRMVTSAQCSVSDLARRLAKRTGRAVETIRYTIRHHDEENPESAIFARRYGTLGDDEKYRLYRHFLRGVPVVTLAQQHGRTRGSIYRIINEMRARQLLERPILFIDNEEFQAPDADKVILDAPPPEGTGKPSLRPPTDLPAYLRSLYEVPLLQADQERYWFRRYNYLKYKGDKRRNALDPNKVSVRQIKAIESILLQANHVKNRLVRSNLRLVVSIAKKHISGPLSLFELISDGNVSLMRAVEKFDYGKGFRFSTYASWAIMRNFARSVPKEKYQLDRFSTGHEEVLDIAASLKSYDPQEGNLSEIRETIDAMLSHLQPRERAILTEHYGLEQNGKVKTFEQLGKGLGISKERVRQIEIQALKKLRALAPDE